MNRRIFYFCLLISCGAYSQEKPESRNGLSSSGEEILRHVWKASWVSVPGASATDYGVFHFRKKWVLKKIPNKLNIFVSADNRYKLFVNGKYVGLGPARGDALNWNYETINIAPWLTTGVNIIAAQVINFGENKPLAQHSYKTGFLLQAEDSIYDILNTGSEGWKVLENKAYQPIQITSKIVNGFYAAGPCDSVDGKKFPWNWSDINYDDNDWGAPVISNLAVSRGYIYGNGIHLVARNIPPLEQKEERFYKIVRSNYSSSTEDIKFIVGQPTVIKSNTKVVFLLDQQYLTIGYTRLLISKGLGSKIKITYAEALLDKDGKKGNRNETNGKIIRGYYDVYHADGGNNRLFETLWMRTFRYVQLEIETGNEDLFLTDFYSVFTTYPFKEVASFKTDDNRLSDIWTVGWRTARLCASETYFDCPYYEQLQYVGDTRIQALISLSVTSDDRLMRNAISLFRQSLLSDGLTQSRYPSNIPQIIPTYSLMWINMLHDYLMYRGDSVFIKQCMQGVISVLNWYENRIDSSGMLANLEWWQFTDYTTEFQLGIPDGVDNGHSALITLQYIYALQNAADMFQYFGDEHLYLKYNMLADKLKHVVVDKCYNAQRGLIAETPEQKRFSIHTSLFAIITNTIKAEEQAGLLKKVLTDDQLIPPAIYFRFYLSRCLQKTGLGDEYLNQIGTWHNMLKQGLTTFSEIENNPRSDCHAWSASPLFDFLTLVAGIAPTSFGFKSVSIAPCFGSLHTIEANYPHPNGTIAVHFDRGEKSKIKGIIQLPHGLEGRFSYMGNTIVLHEGKNRIDL